MFDLPTAAVIYCAILAAVFLGAWVYYDRRDHAGIQAGRGRAAFHCIRCDRLYDAPTGIEVAPCPGCGHRNPRLKF